MSEPKSKGKALQDASLKASDKEQMVPVTARKSSGAEYHLLLPASVVRGIIDPDTPDIRIKVPVPKELQSSVRGGRYVLASAFEEIDVHIELAEIQEGSGG